MSTHSGWQGNFFEDFVVGDVYEHPLGRTVLDADNTWFTTSSPTLSGTAEANATVKVLEAGTQRASG